MIRPCLCGGGRFGPALASGQCRERLWCSHSQPGGAGARGDDVLVIMAVVVMVIVTMAG